MYFGLESVSDLLDFARTLNQTGEAIVFGSECLADVDALAGR
jgi:hypothetical protein